MQTLSTIASLRQTVADWRNTGQTLAFVPTMGNLHDGHIELVRQAKRQADRTIVSIFVNPTQFGPTEDFNYYPRSETEDTAKLSAVGADMLFLPTASEIYPTPPQTRISLPELSNRLCGISRPGHFDGVALVVAKLLNMVQPDILLLGEKDFQQLSILRQMVLDLNMPVTIASVATQRHSDGLAMSSRNSYLTAEQRQTAPLLYQTLCAVRDAILANDTDFTRLSAAASATLTQAGFKVDYLHTCRQHDLQPATTADTNIVILAAAWLDSTRLIDNVCFSG